jgi:multisubunit Na+/H+ antiporter MnhB subunit
MEVIGLLLDLALAVSLLILAGRILHAPGLFQSIALFITFGLVLAMVWVRLDAPDIGLTEAAVGAGLAGALLLDTLRRMRMPDSSVDASEKRDDQRHRSASPLLRTLAGIGGGSLALLLLLGLYGLPRTAAGLTQVVQAHLGASGVDHPVTAVLLNFRGFDTFLELGVLLLAIQGLLCVRGCPGLETVAPPSRSGVVLESLVRGIFPLMLLTTGYLLWTGAFAPGGAFQAGVVLGAGLVLLWMAGHPLLSALPGVAWRLLFAAGFGTFLITGSIVLFQGMDFLEYPPDRAGLLILLLESAATASIAAIMAGLFLALQPLHSESEGGAGVCTQSMREDQQWPNSS